MPITRTDLAMECFENADSGAIPGTQVSHWESDGIEITEVLVTDNEAAQLLDASIEDGVLRFSTENLEESTTLKL